MTNNPPEIEKCDDHINGALQKFQRNAKRLFATKDWADWLLKGNS